MKIRTGLIAAVVALTGLSAQAVAQDRLEPVRALYASADYEAAFAALGSIDAGADARLNLEADGFRASCLIALGRPADADVVIERILMAYPDFDPGADASPRVQRAFRTVSNRVLPPLARRLYDDGKAAFDRGAYAEALRIFEQAMPVITALSLQGLPGMEDRRVLTNSFLTLSRQLTPRPPVVPSRLESRVVDPATSLPPAVDLGPAPPPQVVTTPPAATPPAAAPPVATPEVITPQVVTTQPVIIRQDLPAWPGMGGQEAVFQGAVDVLIDEHGAVTDARTSKSVHPYYDALLLEAARHWSYEPARRDGRPVPMWKRIAVTLRNR
jgi:TonB family protein